MTDCLLCESEATELVLHDFGPVRLEATVCKQHSPADELQAVAILMASLEWVKQCIEDRECEQRPSGPLH